MYSENANKVEFSGVRAIFDRAAQYDDVINLCLGEPGFLTAQNVIDVAVKHLKAGETKYTPNLGIPALREAICQKLRAENGIEADPQKNIIVTIGATQALMLTVLLFAGPGDEVIIPDPSWPNYRSEVFMAGAKPVGAKLVEENGFCMTAETIEPLITQNTKLIMLNSPANPTGGVLPANEIAKIAELVRKYRIPVMSDEPYEKMVYDGMEHVSLASYRDISDLVVTINSFSKTFAMTGFRVGYACAAEDVIQNMVKLHEPMTSCVNEAFQYACIEALQHSDDYLQMMFDTYTKNRKLLVDGLNSLPGISCRPPAGTFYAFANIKQTGMTSMQAAHFMLDEARVVCSPGSAFGDAGEGYIRFSFAAGSQSIEQAVERMEKAMKP